MKILLIAESREGKLLGGSYELVAFAAKMNAESVMFLVGSDTVLPKYDGKVYLADAASAGEYNPDVHKQLILDVVGKENPDMIALCHSSYGWDLAPRIAYALKAASKMKKGEKHIAPVPIAATSCTSAAWGHCCRSARGCLPAYRQYLYPENVLPCRCRDAVSGAGQIATGEVGLFDGMKLSIS